MSSITEAAVTTHSIFLKAWEQSAILRDASLHINRWNGHDARLEYGYELRLIQDDTDFVLYVFDCGQVLLSETRFRNTPESVMVAAIVASADAIQERI